jgi:hypothetical protein
VVEHLPSKYKSLEFCKIPPTKKKKNKLCSWCIELSIEASHNNYSMVIKM